MSRLAAFASFCSQSPPCKSPMLNDVDVSPICIKTPPSCAMSAVVVVEAVEEPRVLSHELQLPHSLKLDPAAQEFRPELRTTQAVISSLTKQGHHLSVAAPSFVPRQLQNTQSLAPPQLPMPTESATRIPNTSCGQSVLLEDSSQARISGCLDRMRQIHARHH
ncbi:hypothetical protein AB1Y20_013505 [Prymnesium parvum]|uniref:Uncharacterized protein n=1 Tax=Prymnesium parvum TaxID=97485 RepID=A0AB34IGI3_PRYPA